MRLIEKVEGTCDPCPDLTQIERPSPGLLGDVFVRGNHMGANVWIFTVYASLADAQSQVHQAGVAGSEFPEESGQWPVTNNEGFPPNTTGWVLHLTRPETPPDAPCYVIWRWTTDYPAKASAAVCGLLEEYVGPGKSFEGAVVQCGDPGEQHPARLIYVTVEDATARGSLKGYSGRGVLVRVGLRVSRLELDDVSASETVQRWVGAIAAILHERRSELGIAGVVEFSAVGGAEPDAGSPALYGADLRFGMSEHLKREA